MHISKFQPRNFKSFYEPAPIRFSSGFNIITGQNSAGKTALLEALTFTFGNKPHRSLLTAPKPGVPLQGVSTANLTVEVTTSELKDLLAGLDILGIPFPDIGEMQAIAGTQNQDPKSANVVLKWLFEEERSLRFSLQYNGSNGSIIGSRVPSFGLYKPQFDPSGYLAIRFKVGEDGKITFRELVRSAQAEDLANIVGSRFRQRIYRFSSERFNIGVSEYGSSRVLAGNASNLPAVLNLMNENPKRVEEFNEIVHSILPQVTQFSMRSISNTQTEVLIWNIDPTTKRADLAVPLNDCGTGIGQVLAILYVAVNSELPQTILIDEPQSFLHPGAARKLIEVLKSYPQHQYIIATHSPTVITAANPSTTTVLRLENGATSLEEITAQTRTASELYLNEIGARLSDVFGADNVLWVEGRTEEICVPMILGKLANRNLMGTTIVGVRQTGDLSSRDARKILEIYNQITRSATLLPPAVAFVLDLETRSRQEQEDLRKLSRGLLSFTTRRTYENYLLDPSAIAAVISQIANFRTPELSADEASAFIEEERKNKKYFVPSQLDASSSWRTTIDGAKLLGELFSHFSANRVSYDKVEHSVLLTQWILDNAPSALDELCRVYTRALDAVGEA